MNQCEKCVCKLYTMILLVLYAHICLNTHFSFCVCIYFKHKQRQYAPQRLSWNNSRSDYASRKCSVVYVIISESPETRLAPISIRMHKVESRETSNRKYLSKTILACRERQAKKPCKLLTKFTLGAIKAVVRANKTLFAFALYLNGSYTNNLTIPGRKTSFAVAFALCINGPCDIQHKLLNFCEL